MKQYIGITIGPIGDTMSLTSSPAGLWAASYLFSYLAHSIREKIGKPGLIQDDLFYKDGKTVSSLFEKGIGMYHDRVIYQMDEQYTLKHANAAVKSTVSSIVDGFAESKIFSGRKKELSDFFYSYFNIHIVCVEVDQNDNILLVVNDALDAAELEKNFASHTMFNPILELFDGNDKGKNEEIKQSFLVPKDADKKNINRQWILLDGSAKGIKDLPSISSAAKAISRKDFLKQPKSSVYYAIIQADGDNMGQTIKDTITDEKTYIEFSEKCMRYGCNAAEIVLRYGGIPIYVGGDDLLCIAPLMCSLDDGEHTFLEMIKEIRKCFTKEFNSGPDLSFGVQIQYVKTPLYEALNESARLLFNKAKKNKPGALAINLRKHSGQSAEILINDLGNIETGEKIRESLDKLIRKHVSEKTLNSVGKHIADFSALFNQAAKEGSDSISNFFINTFDNGILDNDKLYLDKIKELTLLLHHANLIKRNDEDIANQLGSYIRLLKFFSETVDREEEKL